MADNKIDKRSENELIPQNNPTQVEITKYVEQLGRYEGNPKPPDTTYSDIGEYLNQREEYRGASVPSLVLGKDKIGEYINSLDGYSGKQRGSQEGNPVTHTNFKGAIDLEYINPDLVPIEVLRETTNFTPFRKTGSLQQCPGHKLTVLPSLPIPVNTISTEE